MQQKLQSCRILSWVSLLLTVVVISLANHPVATATDLIETSAFTKIQSVEQDTREAQQEILAAELDNLVIPLDELIQTIEITESDIHSDDDTTHYSDNDAPYHMRRIVESVENIQTAEMDMYSDDDVIHRSRRHHGSPTQPDFFTCWFDGDSYFEESDGGDPYFMEEE